MIDEGRKTMRPVTIEYAFADSRSMVETNTLEYTDKDAKMRLAQGEFEEIDTVIALAIPCKFKAMNDIQRLEHLRIPDGQLYFSAFRDDTSPIGNDGNSSSEAEFRSSQRYTKLAERERGTRLA